MSKIIIIGKKMKISVIIAFLLSSSLASFANEFDDMKFLTENNPPYVIVNNDQPISGEIGTKVVKAFAKLKLDTKKIEVLPWTRALLSARNNKNVMLFPVAKTFERLEYLDFAIKVFEQKLYFYKLKKNQSIKLSKFDDAKNYSICVVSDTNTHEALKYEKFTNFEETNQYINNIEKFLNNRCQLIILSDRTVKEKLKDFNASLADVEQLIEAEKIDGNMYVTFSKGTNPKVIKKFKKAFSIN